MRIGRGGVGLGVGLGGGWRDQMKGLTGGGPTRGRTKGRTEGADRTRWLVKFSQVSFWFADMSCDGDVIHPTCPSLDKVNFDLDKITARFITVMAEAGRTS